ncbi:MAG: hypothetical protein JWN67_873 [Actinomycetia bacterium]|nr:hypothetical protein [Actinomycetes bacterium]
MAAIAWDRIEERTDRSERVAPRSPLQLVTAPPSRRQPSAATYRRRRLVALVVGLALLVAVAQLASGALFSSASAGTGAPAGPTVLVAERGDSYWSLAGEVSPGGDLRSTVDALVDANGGGDLHVGDRIVLPD